MNLEHNLKVIREQIAQTALNCGRNPQEIQLIAASKGRSVEEIQEAYALGVRDFGENRVMEALEKMERLPADIRWHYIGKLQKNKVNKVVGRFTLIHSVDTVELAKKLSHVSLDRGVKTSILLEVNVSGEETKSGFTPQELEAHFPGVNKLEGIEIEGLMTMAPFTDGERMIRHCFTELKRLAEALQVTALSMGMTHDFPQAIEEGATHVRIGTALFSPGTDA